jgi:hypothetical protein
MGVKCADRSAALTGRQASRESSNDFIWGSFVKDRERQVKKAAATGLPVPGIHLPAGRNMKAASTATKLMSAPSASFPPGVLARNSFPQDAQLNARGNCAAQRR